MLRETGSCVERVAVRRSGHQLGRMRVIEIERQK